MHQLALLYLLYVVLTCIDIVNVTFATMTMANIGECQLDLLDL